MDTETLKAIAGQLRKPEGEMGVEVGNKMNEGNLTINKYTIEELKPEAGDNILEIGMGNGAFVKEILTADDNIKYTGCDFSSTMVAEARKNNQQYVERGQAAFLSGNVNKLPFQKNSFNKIFTINCIYFWDEAGAAISEIKRVLAPGGKLLISIRPKSIMATHPFIKWGFTLYSKEDVSNLLRNKGFEGISVVEKEEADQELAGAPIKLHCTIIMAIKTQG